MTAMKNMPEIMRLGVEERSKNHQINRRMTKANTNKKKIIIIEIMAEIAGIGVDFGL